VRKSPGDLKKLQEENKRFQKNRLQNIRNRIMDAYYVESSVNSVINDVAQSADPSPYSYDWSCVQKRVCNSTQSLYRKNKEIEYISYEPDKNWSRAIESLDNTEHRLWLLLTYTGRRSKGYLHHMVFWALNQYLGLLKKPPSEKTVSKCRIFMPYAIFHVMREACGAKAPYNQLEVALLNGIKEKNWENNWQPRYNQWRKILRDLDKESLLACEQKFYTLNQYSA